MIFLSYIFTEIYAPSPNKYTKNDFEVSSIPPAWAVITVLMKCKTASFCAVATKYSIFVIFDACIPCN